MAEKGKKITPFVEWLEQYKKGEVDGELTHEWACYSVPPVTDSALTTGQGRQVMAHLALLRSEAEQAAQEPQHAVGEEAF